VIDDSPWASLVHGLVCNPILTIYNDSPSAIPSKIPARKNSAASLMNFVSSLLALALPVFNSPSETAKTFFPSFPRRETCVCLNHN